MIEVDKMLHLQRYMKLFRNTSGKSSVTCYLQATRVSPKSSLHTGYNFCYLHHRVPQTQSQTNFITNIRTFSTVIQSSIENIDDKLTLFCDGVKNGELSAQNLKEIIKICDADGYQLHHSTSILLLKCCGDLLSNCDTMEKESLTDQVWNLVQRKSEILTLEHFNTLLNVHLENLRSLDPNKFLSSMTVKPDDNTLHLLLNIAVKTGNNEYLRDILPIIKEKKMSINADTLSTLVETYAATGNIAEAEATMTFMKNNNYSVEKSYVGLACGYARTGDIPNLVKILNDELQSNADNISRIIEALSSSNNGRHIPVILNFLTGSLKEDKSQMSTMIAKLVRKDRVEDAYSIVHWSTLNNTMTDISKDFVNVFLKELIMVNTPIKDIIKYASDFVDSGCEPQALTNIAEINLKLGREASCLEIFHSMKQKNIEIRPHYYWPLLIIAHRNGREPKIWSLVKHMVDTDVELDSDTLVNHVLPYVNTSNTIHIWQILLSNKIMKSTAYISLVSFLLLNNRLQDATVFCKYLNMQINYRELIKPLAHAYINTKDIKSCITLLTLFPLGQQYVSSFLLSLLNDARFDPCTQDIQSVLKAFKIHGLRISLRDKDIIKRRLIKTYPNIIKDVNLFRMIDGLEGNIEESGLAVIPLPKHMTTNELVCHLQELKSQNMNSIAILRRLLQIYCNENKLKKAEQIKQEMDIQRYYWTPGMKMHLFELYIKNDKLEKAEALLFEIQNMQRTVKIDNIKILMFATALIKANRCNAAFKVIGQFNDINSIRKTRAYCYTLLNTMAHSQYYDHTREMLHLLVEKNYCKISTELLRPLIAVPLKQNDVLAATNIFVECVQKYQKIPMAQELLTTLLWLRDDRSSHDIDTYIKEIYNLIANFSGVDVATTLLAIALARLKKTEELQAILGKQKISISTLTQYFSYARRIQDTNNLITFFDASSDMSDIDQTALCHMLFSVYNEAGDYRSALKLWEKMRAKDIKVHEEVKTKFIQLILSNKLPLPPELEVNKEEVNVNN